MSAARLLPFLPPALLLIFGLLLLGVSAAMYLGLFCIGIAAVYLAYLLLRRLRTAADYLDAHPDVICIVSGGQGSGEEITEAACMAQYLQDAGISPERIWQEDRAKDTRENLLFSLALIAERTGAQPACIGVLSSEYHLYRAKQLAQSLGVRAVGVAAPTSLLYAKVNYFIREAVAVWYTWLLK